MIIDPVVAGVLPCVDKLKLLKLIRGCGLDDLLVVFANLFVCFEEAENRSTRDINLDLRDQVVERAFLRRLDIVVGPVFDAVPDSRVVSIPVRLILQPRRLRGFGVRCLDPGTAGINQEQKRNDSLHGLIFF